MRRLALISALSSLCLGCATVTLDFTPSQTLPKPLPPRSADQVELFMTQAPDRPFAEVGVIELQQEQGNTDKPSELVAKMRTYAGQQGCDGLVILDKQQSVSETMLVQGGGSRVYDLSHYRASCIVYPVAAAPVPPPSAATH